MKVTNVKEIGYWLMASTKIVLFSIASSWLSYADIQNVWSYGGILQQSSTLLHDLMTKLLPCLSRNFYNQIVFEYIANKWLANSMSIKHQIKLHRYTLKITHVRHNSTLVGNLSRNKHQPKIQIFVGTKVFQSRYTNSPKPHSNYQILRYSKNWTTWSMLVFAFIWPRFEENSCLYILTWDITLSINFD